MSGASSSSAAASPEPVKLVSYGGVPIARLRTATLRSVVPFDLTSCTVEAAVDPSTAVMAREWKLRAKVVIGLSVKATSHWVAASSASTGTQVCVPLSQTTADAIYALSASLVVAFGDAFGKASSPVKDLRVFIMSEPAGEVGRVVQFRPAIGEPLVNERVFLADTAAELSRLVVDLLASFFVDGQHAPTAVFLARGIPFPVNVHTRSESLRRAEHEELLLPRRGLLHPEQAAHGWDTVEQLATLAQGMPCVGGEGDLARVRTGAEWERHLVTNPHMGLSGGPSARVDGAATHLTTGEYDYYHYRVDGFRDDGWGCAYRSLQTILSWFQHEGLMTVPMPTLRDIQKILSVVDPDKTGKRDFVGSNEWIGSFEIMLVLQHFVPGLECTIRRLESGAALDTDPAIQRQLFEHFGQERAPPVMIGGSSYAHTILGVHMNLRTTEAQYLILDPHYSANPTNLRTAVNKGYVGWKQASKFFEANQWYNVCIPRVDLYDPR